MKKRRRFKHTQSLGMAQFARTKAADLTPSMWEKRVLRNAARERNIAA